MENIKRVSKKITGWSFEVKFVPDGYKVVWDHRIRMNPAEYRFFCDYFSDKWQALLHLGAVSLHSFSYSSPSVRTIHSLAVDFLRIAASCQTVDELKSKIDNKTEVLKQKILQGARLPIESIQSIYLNLIQTISEISGQELLSDVIESLYAKQFAANTIKFSIEETPQNSEAPYKLYITCGYKNKDVPLCEAIKKLGDDISTRDTVAAVIKKIAVRSSLISQAYNDGNIKDCITLSHETIYTFLKEHELYENLGISCRVPKKLKWRRSALSLNISMKQKSGIQLGTDSITDFDINLSIEGEKLTDKEIEELLESNSEVFQFRGEWVEFKHKEMCSCLKAYENLLLKNKNGVFSLSEAMQAFLSPDSMNDDEEDFYAPEVTFNNEEWLSHISDSINADEHLLDISKPSSTFTASLRPYQIVGVNWLNKMRRMQLGACLSDDMGLGKTLQVIAVLEQLRNKGAGASLIVLPASLLQNWQDELTRFAPLVKFRILHSSYGNMNISPLEDTNVYITTYAMLARLPQIKKKVWECVILDEAQAIKNPRTLQSKASKQLKANFRIAMTGTPIENSISDLISIFEFLNPQFFGNSLEILSDENDPDIVTKKLKNFAKPFILRRLKTDKNIIDDLPDKIEMKSYCNLTQRQAVLYKQIINALCDELSDTHGIERRGLVLSSILKLKQICNHPDQYIGNGAYLQSESGKMSRLVEICEDIKNRNERVLVFTQFKEMCEPLNNILREVFNKEGLIINGSVNISERGKIVEKFNNSDEYIPYIVLSLRAGGVGLNLTAANHVIHFDRWWNPAVENQATDRSFRIGQVNNVIVHKLICKGTLEEKIDRMIDQKSNIAMDIVENDTKITELSNEELIALLHMES